MQKKCFPDTFVIQLYIDNQLFILFSLMIFRLCSIGGLIQKAAIVNQEDHNQARCLKYT